MQSAEETKRAIKSALRRIIFPCVAHLINTSDNAKRGCAWLSETTSDVVVCGLPLIKHILGCNPARANAAKRRARILCLAGGKEQALSRLPFFSLSPTRLLVLLLTWRFYRSEEPLPEVFLIAVLKIGQLIDCIHKENNSAEAREDFGEVDKRRRKTSESFRVPPVVFRVEAAKLMIHARRARFTWAREFFAVTPPPRIIIIIIKKEPKKTAETLGWELSPGRKLRTPLPSKRDAKLHNTL